MGQRTASANIQCWLPTCTQASLPRIKQWLLLRLLLDTYTGEQTFGHGHTESYRNWWFSWWTVDNQCLHTCNLTIVQSSWRNDFALSKCELQPELFYSFTFALPRWWPSRHAHYQLHLESLLAQGRRSDSKLLTLADLHSKRTACKFSTNQDICGRDRWS